MVYQFKDCVACDRQILADEEMCRYCGVEQEREPASVGDVFVHGSVSEWSEYRVSEQFYNPVLREEQVKAVDVDTGEPTILQARQFEEAGWALIRQSDYDGSSMVEADR